MTQPRRLLRTPTRPVLLTAPVLLAAGLLLAGCGSSAAAPQPDAALSSPSAMSGMPGMATADDAAHPGHAAGDPAGGPTETARMVCGGRVADAIAQALALDAPPSTVDSWAAPVYTCTYALPMGPLVLTVQVTPDAAAAGAAFDADRARRDQDAPLPGLGERAFGTPAGVTEVVKDDQVLTVDATGLPEVFGANGQLRTDFANEVAAAVMGCWIAHG